MNTHSQNGKETPSGLDLHRRGGNMDADVSMGLLHVHPENPLQMTSSEAVRSDAERLPAQTFENRKDEEAEVVRPQEPSLALADLQYAVDDSPPWYIAIFLALQHYMVYLGPSLAKPVLVAGTVCTSDPNVISVLLGNMIFTAGISTLLQTFLGVRLPIVQSIAFAYYTPMITLTKLGKWKCPSPGDPNYGPHGDIHYVDRLNTVIGSMMAASAVEIVIGATGLVSVLLRFIGPLTVAPTIMLMALPVAGMGFRLTGLHWGVAIGVMALILVFAEAIPIYEVRNPFAKDGRKMNVAVHKMFSVVMAMLLMWLLCYILTVTNVFPTDPNKYGYRARTDIRLDVISKADWFKFPYPGVWGRPGFSTPIFIAMLTGVVSSIVESIGDYYTCARLAGAPQPPVHAVNRGIMIEGIDSLISVICGSVYPVTSYSSNISIIDITKVGSRQVVLIAGIIMVVVGCFGKFSAAMVTMPDPIIGASFLLLYAVLTAVGVSNLQFVDLNSSRNMVVFGMALFMGLGFPAWHLENDGIVQTGSETADEILNVLLANNMFVGAFVAILLDNVLPGTPEERGISHWLKKSGGDTSDTKSNKIYDLPCGMRFIRRWRWTRYIPFMPTFQGFFNPFSRTDES